MWMSETRGKGRSKSGVTRRATSPSHLLLGYRVIYYEVDVSKRMLDVHMHADHPRNSRRGCTRSAPCILQLGRLREPRTGLMCDASERKKGERTRRAGFFFVFKHETIRQTRVPLCRGGIIALSSRQQLSGA